MRKKIIAGNWKMNYTINEGEDFLNSIVDSINTNEVEVVICPNFTMLDRFSDLLSDKNIKLGAQNVFYEVKGAYTGETSPYMLKAVGVDYCIVGHSERRTIFKENDEEINNKIKALLELDINPILCVGETLEERNDNKHLEKVASQVIYGLKDVDENFVKRNIVIAYEPIWAIGTGVTATSDEAEEMCAFIRKTIEKKYNRNVADSVRILYGGSVKAENAKEIMEKEDIDGALVGGASLKNDFTRIVNFD